MAKALYLLFSSCLFSSHPIVAIPFSPLSSAEYIPSLLSLATNESAGRFLTFFNNAIGTGHLPPSNLTRTPSLNHPSESGPGYDWMRHITEGLMMISSEAPDAYPVSVTSMMRDELSSEGTTNIADLQYFEITCFDSDSGDHFYAFGYVDPSTRKTGWGGRDPHLWNREITWGIPARKHFRVARTPQKLHWLPDHDIAQAAARFTAFSHAKFGSIKYHSEEPRRGQFHQVYRMSVKGWLDVAYDVSTLLRIA